MSKKAPMMLKDWLDQEGRKIGWLARKVAVNRSTASLWINGHQNPSPPARRLLAQTTGLDIDKDEAWSE